jgi:hypothetical protein
MKLITPKMIPSIRQNNPKYLCIHILEVNSKPIHITHKLGSEMPKNKTKKL